MLIGHLYIVFLEMSIEMSVQVFCHFKFKLFVSFLLSYRSLLYILDINPLLNI